jgi:hypothetical protein
MIELERTTAVQFEACRCVIVLPSERGDEARRVYREHGNGTCPRCREYGPVLVASVYVERVGGVAQ